MTIEHLAMATLHAQMGRKIVFLTKVAYPLLLLGFLHRVSTPIRIQESMRKAHYKGGGWIIFTDQIDEERLRHHNITIMVDGDC